MASFCAEGAFCPVLPSAHLRTQPSLSVLMLFRRHIFLILLAPLFGARLSLAAQSPSEQPRRASLRQLYLSAQHAQQQNDVQAAASDYRSFVAQAQTELAEAFALSGEDARVGQLLDGLGAVTKSPSVLLNAARAALLSRQLPTAQALASQVVASSSADKETIADAHQVLGRVDLRQHLDKQARQEFELATALNPTFQNGYDLAVACLDLSDEPCAAKVFAEMEHSFGDKPELHVAIGRAYANSDFQPRAVKEFQRAIEEAPAMPGTHYLLAAVLLANGAGDSSRIEAQKQLEAELLISPHDAATYAALGQIAFIEKQYPNSEDLLQKAILYGPSLPEPYLYLGEVDYDTGKMNEAESALRSAIRLTTDVARNRYQIQKAHYLLGRILAQRGQAEEAHKELQLSRQLADKALALDKTSLAGMMTGTQQGTTVVDSPNGASDTAVALTLNPEALAKARALESELRPPLADAYNNLGVLAATQSDYAQATLYFRKAAEWDPKLEGLDYNWGRAAFAGKLYGEATGPLSRYVAAHPDDPGARSVLAISDFQQNAFQDCVNALAPIPDKTQLDPAVRFDYAQALVKVGRINDGIAILEVLAAANPNIAELQNALAKARQAQTAAAK